MFQLNYQSIARPGLGLEDLNHILEESIATNSARNISGCLIYHNDRFVQILEGSKKDVRQVYNKIREDDRHNNVTLLWENHVEHRFFEEWSMAFYSPSEVDVRQFENNLILLSELSEKPSGALLIFWATVRKLMGSGTISHFEKS